MKKPSPYYGDSKGVEICLEESGQGRGLFLFSSAIVCFPRTMWEGLERV